MCKTTLNITQENKKKKGLCITLYCRKTRPRGSNYCYCCIWRRLKERDYVRYVFYYTRSNAKRRGKEFSLTINQFREFCKSTGYIEGKGRFKNNLSIDRIDNSQGYHADNIRVLTISENSSKGVTEDYPF